MPLDIFTQISVLDRQLSETENPLGKAHIYLQAGQLYDQADQIEEACFFMTQAFIFAIHHGDTSTEHIARQYLQAYDRI